MRLARLIGSCAAIGLAALASSGWAAAATPRDFFAVVNADGTLARGTAGTTTTHVGTGLYNVVFPRWVGRCAAVANLGYAGTNEVFTFQSAVTTTTIGRTVWVDVTYPGDTTAGSYPDQPVLEDNSFHLHVDCGHALYADVSRNGAIRSASAGVTAGPHARGSGRYVLNFGQDISACAPVATASTGSRSALAVQPYLALGADGKSLVVSVNNATTAPVDDGFDVIVTCDESPYAVFPFSLGFNTFPIANASDCALTASWYDPTPGSAPSDQGYVSTWAPDSNTAGLLTKNGGYGVQGGYGADLVATC